ncbi:hypothetical protein LN040_03970 [Desulfovibrio subterraneus]|uniref:hypothetical protein n=1 Tax=Desulfovibrio subterraneus TaxID=2718620 RepID=UPI0022B91735|nr:hypothetical protein [Desulfovibrio subterraneus]WBF68271.1 hypothetical protein LN040_03970 [Desulfovibrio subterraneus]
MKDPILETIVILAKIAGPFTIGAFTSAILLSTGIEQMTMDGMAALFATIVAGILSYSIGRYTTNAQNATNISNKKELQSRENLISIRTLHPFMYTIQEISINLAKEALNINTICSNIDSENYNESCYNIEKSIRSILDLYSMIPTDTLSQMNTKSQAIVITIESSLNNLKQAADKLAFARTNKAQMTNIKTLSYMALTTVNTKQQDIENNKKLIKPLIQEMSNELFSIHKQ